MKKTVANNRPTRMNKKDFSARRKFRRSERTGADKDGQRHWEAKDSGVACKPEEAAEPSG
jgi:hypothetical protein